MAKPATISEQLHLDPAPAAGVAVTRLGRDDRPERVLHRGSLLREVEAFAARLVRAGLVGRPVLIPERNGLEYAVAFLGCLRAGSLAVTAHPPRPGGGGDRLAAIVRHSRPAAIVGRPAVLEAMERQVPGTSGTVKTMVLEVEGACASAVGDDAEIQPDASIPWPDPDAIAMLQYTSGSTRDPAPVALTHRNLCANGNAMRSMFARPDRPGGTVCWMPLYHDMGLIGLFISSLLVHRPIHLMDPESFAMRPERWLRAVSNTGAAYSGGPCFAYDLCVDRISEEVRGSLDLSTWRFAFNGAEPVRMSSLSRFQETFGPCGFDGMMPCYGLAEHTLLVSIRNEDEPVRARVVDRAGLDEGRLDVRRKMELQGRMAFEVASDEVAVVSCGSSIPDHEIVVRDPDTGKRLSDGRVGEITLRGPSVASGYHQRDDLTTVVFPEAMAGEVGPWLRTGDLGSLVEGELHVLGRLKDLLIVDGRNVHPADVEATIEMLAPDLGIGRAAVFACPAEDDGPEVVAAVVELDRAMHRATRRDVEGLLAAVESVRTAVRSAVSSVHGLRVQRLVVTAPNALPRTTSGKVRRGDARVAMLARRIQALPVDHAS